MLRKKKKKKKGGIFEPGAPLVHMYHGTFLPPTYMHDCSNPEASIGVRVVPCHSSVSTYKDLVYSTQDVNLFN